jgi:hypothetical protein
MLWVRVMGVTLVKNTNILTGYFGGIKASVNRF